MKWRFSKLDWKYAIGELIIVTVGVLVALGVDQWRQERESRDLELDYAERIKADLREDILRFGNFEEIELTTKREVLEALARAEDVKSIINQPIITAQNLDMSTYQALPPTLSVTFEELKNTGNFRLIQNPEMRVKLDDYYSTHTLLSGILAESPSDYILILQGSLPGLAAHETRVSGRDYTEEEKSEGFKNFINNPARKETVNAELFYAANLTFWLHDIRLNAEETLSRLEIEYPL